MTRERTGGRFDVVRKDALAWALGLVVFFPFFLALRQLLEHRDDMADRRVD